MSASLYNCKAEIDRDGATHYRITKFNADLEVESSYRTTSVSCECPGFERRQRCRHTEMLPSFIRAGAIAGQWFYDYDTKGWFRAQAEVEFEPKADLPPCPPMAEIPPDSVAVSTGDFDSPSVGSNPARATNPFRRL